MISQDDLTDLRGIATSLLIEKLEAARARIASLEQHACPVPWRVKLPKISPEVLQNWDGAIALIEHTDEGPQWDDNAVDFAAMLQETMHGAGSSDRAQGLSQEDREACNAGSMAAIQLSKIQPSKLQSEGWVEVATILRRLGGQTT